MMRMKKFCCCLLAFLGGMSGFVSCTNQTTNNDSSQITEQSLIQDKTDYCDADLVIEEEIIYLSFRELTINKLFDTSSEKIAAERAVCEKAGVAFNIEAIFSITGPGSYHLIYLNNDTNLYSSDKFDDNIFIPFSANTEEARYALVKQESEYDCCVEVTVYLRYGNEYETKNILLVAENIDNLGIIKYMKFDYLSTFYLPDILN